MILPRARTACPTSSPTSRGAPQQEERVCWEYHRSPLAAQESDLGAPSVFPQAPSCCTHAPSSRQGPLLGTACRVLQREAWERQPPCLHGWSLLPCQQSSRSGPPLSLSSCPAPGSTTCAIMGSNITLFGLGDKPVSSQGTVGNSVFAQLVAFTVRFGRKEGIAFLTREGFLT